MICLPPVPVVYWAVVIMKLTSRARFLLFLTFLVPTHSPGQDEERNKALRILAVGSMPPWAELPIGGRRLEQPPPPGSTPPHQVQLATEEGTELGNPLRVRLNNMSAVLPVKPGKVELHEVTVAGLSADPWHSLQFPRKPAALGLLWRDPVKKKWSKAQSLLLADDLTSFPAGRIRVINVSNYPVLLEYGEAKKGSLKPRAAILLTRQAKVPLNLYLKRNNGKLATMFSQVMNGGANIRTNVVISNADGVSPTRPVNVIALREPAVTPTVPRP